MFRIFLTLSLLILPAGLCSADPLTKEEYFDLYVERVSKEQISIRMNQLFSALPSGSAKDSAKDLLKQDLIDALDARMANINASLAPFITETEEGKTNVNDTDLQ